MSVVDASFERLKRFNLAEIFDPTPKEAIKESKETPLPSEDVTGVSGSISEPAASSEVAPSTMGIA